MREFLNMMMMEIFPSFDEGEEGGGGAEEAAPTQVDIGGELIDIPEGLDLSDPTEEATEQEEITPAAGVVTADLLKKAGVPEGIAKQLEGKSIDEILKSYANKEIQIGKLGTRIGEQQQQLRNEGKRTSATVKKEQSTLLDQLAEKKAALDELDELIDGNDYTNAKKEYDKLKGKSDKLAEELTDLKLSEMVDARLNTQYNDGAISKMRESLVKDFKMEFDDETWGALADKAKEINGPGEITAEAMESAVIMTLGAETYRKTLTTQGEQNMRDKLKTANSKVMPVLEGTGGKGAKPLDFDSMTPQQQGEVIRSLKGSQFVEVYKKIYGQDPTKF